MKDKTMIKEEIREHELAFQHIFCTSFSFSDAWIKEEDDVITSMYDHHRFLAKKQEICANDIKEAIVYQKAQGCDYLQINTRFPLANEMTEAFHLKESITITMGYMQTYPSSFHKIRTNDQVVIKDIQVDPIEEDLLAIEMKNNRMVYGETFIRQFVSAFSNKAREDHRLHYLGAYLNDEICGYCYYFDDGRYKVLDALTVNEEKRHQYVASSLIAYVMQASESILYLHADQGDTPIQMYRKMGFEDVDITYEYLCTNI